MGEWVDVNKELKLLFVKMQKVRMVGVGPGGGGGGLVGGSGGCKLRIEGIVKWGVRVQSGVSECMCK